jgi:ATP/maltotriose-dependent transcriptional regulator MalT
LFSSCPPVAVFDDDAMIGFRWIPGELVLCRSGFLCMSKRRSIGSDKGSISIWQARPQSRRPLSTAWHSLSGVAFLIEKARRCALGAGDEFVGRSSELALLENVLNAVALGKAGFASVTGEAGIGKSRLLRELGHAAVAQGFLALDGSAAEFELEHAFGVFIQALDAYLETLSDSAKERLSTDRLGELGVVFPALSSLAHAVEQPVSATERFRVHQAVRELLERLAVSQPLALILDDVHWADSASLELLFSLARRPPNAAVIIVWAARTGQGDPAALQTLGLIQNLSEVQNIQLGPLEVKDVEALLGGRLDAQIAHTESGGNPFYALELASVAKAGNRAGKHSARDVGGIPTTVATAISAELSALTPAAREVAETAAVLGDPFDVDLLSATVGGQPDDDVWLSLDELISRDLIRETDVPQSFRFRHPLVRSAVYTGAKPSMRRERHRRAAEALRKTGAPAVALAGHVEQFARRGDASSVAVLQEAGDHNAARAPSDAARWFRAALRLLPDDAPHLQRVNLLTSLASARAAVGDFSSALDALSESIDLLPSADIDLHTQLVVACAEVELLLGHYQEARARLEDSYRALAAADSPTGVSLLIALSLNRFYAADYEGALGWGESAVQAAESLSDPALSAAALSAHALGASWAGRIDAALESHRLAQTLVDDLTDAELALRLDALSNLSSAELYLDLYAQSCVHGERALRIARLSGQTHLMPVLTPVLGSSLWLAGDMQRSAQVLEDAVEAARLVGNHQALSLNLFDRALSALMAGDLEVALSLGAEGVVEAGFVDAGIVPAYAGVVHALTLLESGDPAGARDLILRSAGGDSIHLIAGTWRSTFLESLTRCCLALGRQQEALEAAGRATERATELGLPLPRLMADRAWAAIAMADGRSDDAVIAARSALGHAETLVSPTYLAFALVLLGQALAATGERDEAVGHMEHAVDLFESLGAVRYRNQAEAEMRKLGKAVHRRTRRGDGSGTGVGSLTGRELEIAGLVVDRLTNREIAETLFLSTKTVETHLRNTFSKLGVSSRREMARVLEGQDGSRTHPAPSVG